MIERLKDLIGRGSHSRALSYWSQAAALAPHLRLDDLRRLRNHARTIRQQVDAVEHIASGRLAQPRLGTNAMRKPNLTDWSYRPEAWRGAIKPTGICAAPSQTQMGEATTLFHDCVLSEITLRQIRNTRDTDLAPFGLRLDVLRFEGSFLSIVVDLPESAVDGLNHDHIIRLQAVIETERPADIYARLNIKFGPNVEQILRQVPLHLDEVFVEFDLQHADINRKGLERLWVDLIVERADMNEITFRDISLTRRPRASF